MSNQSTRTMRLCDLQFIIQSLEEQVELLANTYTQRTNVTGNIQPILL